MGERSVAPRGKVDIESDNRKSIKGIAARNGARIARGVTGGDARCRRGINRRASVPDQRSARYGRIRLLADEIRDQPDSAHA